MKLLELISILNEIYKDQGPDTEVLLAINPAVPKVSEIVGVTTDTLSKKNHSGYEKCVLLLEGEHVRYGWSEWWSYAE